MLTEHEKIARAYYQAFNARDWEAYSRLCTPDCVIDAPGVSLRGVDAVRAFDQGWVRAFPQAQIECVRSTDSGERVLFASWIHGGRHDGPMKTPEGEVPATGAVLDAGYAATFEFEGDRIRLQRVIYDPAYVKSLLSGR